MKNLLFALTFIFLIGGQSIYAQSNTPNVLLIIADDMGVDITPGYQVNDPMPTTPTLDALRADGLIFTNAWSAPQCTPTRASIMSGKYGIKTGVMRPPGNLDLEHQSLFSRMQEEHGDHYANAVIGKWHISSPVDYTHPAQHSIDHYEGLFTSSVDDYFEWDKVIDESLTINEEYATTNLTNAAIDWVADQIDPWFLWLAHVAPHGPFHLPPSDLYTVNDTEDDLGKYIAAIEAMDHEIGRLLDSMDDETRDNTIILFVGDNGTPGPVIQNFPTNHSKGTLYEGGVRVPFFISGKGVSRKGEEDDNLCHVVDLYATILELTSTSLQGGVNNSMSLKPLLSCDTRLTREYVYTDYEDGNVLGWAIRNQDYKMIADENGRLEFYKISEDILEENDLVNDLTSEESTLLNAMQAEAEIIRSAWSCNDGIQNGDEVNIDDCDDDCPNDDTLSTENLGCCAVPDQPTVYYEYIEGDRRRIYTNNFPNHEYCYNSANQMPSQVHHDFGMDLNPTIADEVTSILRDNGRPARYFGVAKNGVLFAPAPAAPFIFEDQNTGEFNWDWVLEPTNNQGQGQDVVGLDCASAHTGGQGYHYHGNMFSYVDNEVLGISSTLEIPAEPLHIGWAGDGFPILYRFGPDEDGNIKEMKPSYRVKAGLRPGDNISEPCGAYNGKYTNDYEYICGKGDLDECNGIQSNVTVSTAQGDQTFEYYYVITTSFPQIPRCLVGNASLDFENGSNDPLTGVDGDGDGFLSDFDCDDTDAAINPLAVEIEGNDVDENCDGLFTSVADLLLDEVVVSPNPSDGRFVVQLPNSNKVNITVVGIDGRVVQTAIGSQEVTIDGIQSGVYLLQISNEKGAVIYKKQIVR